MSQNIDESESFVIKTVIAGCCGCESVYSSIVNRRKIQEQLVYEYACRNGLPTKFVFHYDSNDNLFSFDTLVAVTDDTYSFPLTPLERQIVAKMDSIGMLRQEYAKNVLQLKNIRGFRRLKPGEYPHPFPYNTKEKPIYSLRKYGA